MSALINYRAEHRLALIGLVHAPVNALGQPLRSELLQALERADADPDVHAIILQGEGLPFSAGADIHEFGTPRAVAAPHLRELLLRLQQLNKPVIAALSGVALGGGLELALACGYRISEPTACFGLPEIKLGLIPGAGGTQRLPRLIGAQAALDMMISGQMINARRALELGLVDGLSKSPQSLLNEACAFAHQLLERNAPAFPDPRWGFPGSGLPDDFFIQYRLTQQARWQGQLAPQSVISALEAACTLPLTDGLALEAELFQALEASSQSAALRHVFFAERDVGKLPGISADTPTRLIRKVAIIGAGTMGGGIAMCFANAGIPVALLELKAQALEHGLMQIRHLYQISVERGKLTPAQLEQRMELLHGTLDYAEIGDADLVIEAVFESLPVKQQVFRTLDEVCKPGAILASNTSTLDINAIASVTRRPWDVIGLHFFSPASVMRLLEVVRGRDTGSDTLATMLAIAKRLGKVAVVSGVCFGFIGNRMLEPYSREAHRLLLEGASVAQIDRVLTDFGMAMGVLAMHDLAGIDVSYLIRESRRDLTAHDLSYCRIADVLFEQGRYGQKTARGFYLYEGRKRQEDCELLSLAEGIAHELGIVRRVISDEEVHDRCLFMLINEGIQLLDEGIAQRSGDIDLVWINGYGFAAWRGGPLHYAESLGLAHILERIRHYRDALGAYGQMWLQPAPLLERLVAAGHTRIETLTVKDI
ncbi:3-hydroxyacyl-CoA dehydrogenase NAD-binding domain-containing protein [Pseudomonas psychrophila]|uniref:3-hydroxyacyl-CoA dehydrogenase NAD-binding domain-containing protein n=1 Tax=Pseudomonas psychrophila TaxID=122355 RepID=UPI0002F8B790|nr:3-hydroxyacyl-CoA dehydrogenase NAD-binding domain-containing protein [Pseudomonas psychrophila]